MLRHRSVPLVAVPLALAALAGLDAGQSLTPSGRDLATWSAGNEVFAGEVPRCLAPDHVPGPLGAGPAEGGSLGAGTAEDCTYNLTNPSSVYDPTYVFDIPVVFHVIQNTEGTGYVSPAQVQSQIDVFNEDFRALPGTNGAPGVDTRIQFRLATVDPAGNPTTGITYSVNDQWYLDQGDYWTPLHWDTNRYVNVYTNTAGGSLGYVPEIPQAQIVGNPADRVVVRWSTVGKNAPYGLPWDQGRIATHEMGHHLGLVHTFYAGCGSATACYTTGDRICDTAPQQGPTNGCPAHSGSCGSADPIHNYMDYTDDACIWEFTPEQAKRMRCTVEYWRVDLATILPVPGQLTGDVTSISLATGGTQTLDLDAGAAHAFELYWLLGTTAGTSPGQPLPPTLQTLPLNFSSYFLFTALNPGTLIPASLGLLDASGTASTSLTLPPLGASLAGVTLHHAYVVLDATTAQLALTSLALPLALVP